jgi:hypothetical protein
METPDVASSPATTATLSDVETALQQVRGWFDSFVRSM